MQLSSRILTALAVLILAVAVVAVRAGSTGTVEAATGTIDVVNVGTCYTTSTDVFGVGDCNDGDDTEGYSVAGRDGIMKVDSVYATYAIDPKTSGEEPRAIATNSDVIKISINDKGRDKRTGVLFAVDGSSPPLLSTTDTPPVPTADAQTITRAIGLTSMLEDELAAGPPAPTDGTAADPASVTNSVITLTEEATNVAFAQRDGGTSGTIANSGDAEFELALTSGGTGDPASRPMAPKDDGKVYWFGTVTGGTNAGFRNLTDEFIELDEDLSSGDSDAGIAPWMRVTASVPAGQSIQVQYIYYQTSEQEELFGGAKEDQYGTTGDDGTVYPAAALVPVFESDDADGLSLRASGDGNAPNQHLWLKETGRFTGIYEGYLRLTDADGDGKCDDDENDATPDARCNWGLPAKAASGADMDGAANLGVESGPVTVKYTNSNGDNRELDIMIDKDSPTIQIETPVNNVSSKVDSPELIGTFTDGGGSGLRQESFKIYADNTPDGKDDSTPIWDLRVDNTGEVNLSRGYVCVDGDDDTDGCQQGGTAALRGDYQGYTNDRPTFGIVPSVDVYLDDEEDADNDTEADRKTADAENFEDGATDGEFDTVIRIDFPPDPEDDRRYNHIIDIQAVVMDVAGNIGFSDSEPSDPTFIHDFGTKKADRDDDDKHNVLGWFSRHIYILDDVDPKYSKDESATGFFLDSDGDEMRTSSGAKVVFDGKLDPATVGVGTFEVGLDGGSDATVIDVAVDGKNVYLLIEEELAPNATPEVDLAAGQSISDLAGNESTDRRLEGIELNDGILPTFTVTLSGGTGLNEDVDGEGPSELTNEDGIDIAISANEAIQGAPKFVVVCDKLTWGGNSDNNVGKFASNRTGTFTSGKFGEAAPTNALDPASDDNHPEGVTSCGTGDGSEFLVSPQGANRRTGNNWAFDWAEGTGDEELADGKLHVIVWGRDRSSYHQGSDRVFNYSAATATFVYDTDLEAAWEGNDDADEDYGELIPAEGEDVFEVRPFVLLDFGDEGTSVDVTTFEVDDVDHTADLQELEGNEFVWWPEPLAYGTYEVYVEANDAANNTDEHTYSFSVKERAPFVLNLLAGWNSISFPSNPVDRALHAVFTNDAIDQVIGWDATEPVSPWRMATRVDGVWTTNDRFATLNDVEARYGYWVHSTGFVTQAVHLAGKGDRATDGQPNPADIPTDEGWNFVGVVDVDGDQTQDDAGETLRNSNNDPITAAEYLGGYTRAYTWDHVNNTWDVVKKDEGITIGTGVWVYYTKDHDIAP